MRGGRAFLGQMACVVALLLVLGATPAGAQDPTVDTQDPTADAQDQALPEVLDPASEIAPSASEIRAPAAVAPTDDQLDALGRNTRSSAMAVVMSLPVPGWGQLYADSPFWGTVAFSVQMFYLGNIVMEIRRGERQRVARDLEPVGSFLRGRRDPLVTEHRERARDFVWWALGGALLVSLDAYVSVSLVDFDNEFPPIPDLDRDWGQDTATNGGGMGVALQFPF